jgi:hypothetical protein
MKEWTENDSQAMFRRPPDLSIEDDQPGTVDNSDEARRRRRFPFEVNSADDQKRQHRLPDEDDRHR